MTEQALLPLDELNLLRDCEQVIKDGLETFVRVGEALLTIRDRRLYRAEHATFEAYCRDRWGMTRRHANRLVKAAEVVANLGPLGPIPDAERLCRPLGSLPADQQREVWGRVLEETGGERITAAVVERTKAHVTNNSGNPEWYTPPRYIALAREVMGGIDCDPASCEQANEVVGASVYYDAQTDGLRQEWAGRIWLNPPYSQPEIGHFTRAVAEKWRSGEIREAIVLANNATETEWFQALGRECAAVCFPNGRIRFFSPEGEKGTPLQGQAIIYLGSAVERFVSVFGNEGVVLVNGNTQSSSGS